MWKSKKFIVILALAIVALVGGTAGAVLAADSDSTTTTSSPWDTFTSKVASILGLNEETVQDAMEQAQQEIQNDAMKNRLDEMVAEGKITPYEADDYLNWWQARPDVELPGLMGGGFGGFGGGMMGGGGHHHWGDGPNCAPDSSGDTST